MSNHNESAKITYTYSAKEQEEFKKIRQKYDTQAENKADRLRRLDAGVKKKATATSLILGIAGTLIYGCGTFLLMRNLSVVLCLWSIVGMALCAVGLIVAVLAYPVYKLVGKKERNRIAPEVLRLADDLIK